MCSEIYLRVNDGIVYDVLVGRCGENSIYIGHKEPFRLLGVHKNGNVWRGKGQDASYVGKYEDQFVYQIQNGKKIHVGTFQDGHIYIKKQGGYTDIGHYTCEPIAAAAALLFYSDYTQVLRNLLFSPTLAPLEPPYKKNLSEEMIRKAVDQMYR